MKIRKARLADAPVIAEFNRSLAWETEHRRLIRARVLNGVKALLKDAVKGVYFVAEHDGIIVGQLLITYEWSDWRNGNFWWMQSVFVAEEFRGQGIFSALFRHVRRLAQARKDVCGLRLYMHADNKTAARAYKKLGMARPRYEVFEMDFAN
ncbi:MAG: GNAT family N-acetyltransferase [Verrucomicrobia bacterium]|nr:GNAT family N-acetyltransferase [Verrucomicrobiota bacterium]